MKKKRLNILLLIFMTVFYSKSAFTIDTSIFSIKINNFSEKIFKENSSMFKLVSDNKNFILLNTGFQKIIKNFYKKGERVLIIKNGNFTGVKTGNYKTDPQYLQNTQYLNLESKEIKKISSNFIDSKNLIPDVEKFVYNIISKKIIGIPLLPAVNILKSRSGDCTEHSTLVLSILRTLKVPSRAVVGVYLAENFLGEKNIFVYHMWVEALYKNKWHLVDATRPGDKQHNRYIAFSYHSLKTEMPLSFLRTISAIQNLRISYIK